MGWKDWPYWFKGGIIGIILTFIYMVIGVIGSFSDPWAGLAVIIGVIAVVPVFLVFSIIGSIFGMGKVQRKDNFNGISSLIFGILSIFFSFFFYVAPLAAILGIITSRIQKKVEYTSSARWGFILSIIGIVLSIVFALFVFLFVNNIYSNGFGGITAVK